MLWYFTFIHIKTPEKMQQDRPITNKAITQILYRRNYINIYNDIKYRLHFSQNTGISKVTYYFIYLELITFIQQGLN